MANRRGVCVNAQRDNKMEGAIHVKGDAGQGQFLARRDRIQLRHFT